MVARRLAAWLLTVVGMLSLGAGCSLQNFDYLKGEYKSGSGGSTGGTSLGGSAGSAGSSVSSGGSGNAAGATGLGGSAGDIAVGLGGDAGALSGPPGMLVNPGFELGSATTVPGWSNVGDVAAASVVFQQPHSGSGRLGHWLPSGAYKVSTSQVVQGLPDGNYTFSMWVDHSLFLNAEYIFARGYSLAEPAAQIKVNTTSATDASYAQIVIPSIPVTSGKCEVGLYTDGGADSVTNWSLIDDAELTLVP